MVSQSIKKCPGFPGHFVFLLYEPCLFEGDEGSSLLHRLEALCRDANGDLFVELRDEEGLGLEVYLAASLARRVELGSTNTVGVFSYYL